MIYNLEDMNEVERHSVSLQSTKSYTHYHTRKYTEQYVSILMEKTGDKKLERAIRWWVTNTARAIRNKATGITVSLDKNHYTGNVQKISYRHVMRLLEWLETNSFIHIYKGYVEQWKIVNGKRIPDWSVPSVAVFRERWLNEWKDHDRLTSLFSAAEESDLVVVRDRKTKEAKPTKGHAGIKEMKEKVMVYNSSLEDADITFNGVKIADVLYSRIFTEDTKHGGRLYVMGGGVQVVSAELRKTCIQIDGENVKEADFHAVQPNICYQLLHNSGESVRDVVGEDFSPYGANLSFIEVNQDLKKEIEQLTREEHKPIRNLVKLALLIAMNSDDERQAVAALSSKIAQDRTKEKSKQKFYAVTDVNSRMVLKAVAEHNHMISDQFYSDAGMWLQKIDSDIMLDVIDQMIQRGHKILCYHDSALVKESAAEDLKQAMINAWKNVLGDTTYCRVDFK